MVEKHHSVRHSPAPLHCCENTPGTKTLQIKLAAVLLLILQSPWGTRRKPPLLPIPIIAHTLGGQAAC